MLVSKRPTLKWRADRPDFNDFKFSDYFPIVKPKWGKRTNNIIRCPSIDDQGQLGSCTANALDGHLRFIHPGHPNFSRLFIYWLERSLEGTIDSDSGAEIRDGIKVLQKWGACLESLWPYDTANFKTQPSDEAFGNATKDLINAYYRIANVTELKQCLNDGFIATYGFTCYETFDSDLVAQTGYLPLPKKGETSIGGHAVCCIDYGIASDFMELDEISNAGISSRADVFLIRNSWGTQWGLKRHPGYFVTPQEYLANPDLADDFWTIRK